MAGHQPPVQWNAWTWTTLTTLLLVAFNAFPVSHATTIPTRARALQARDAIANGIELRVLPIGDSITWGAKSSDDNGYRDTVWAYLVGRGNNVDFVGAVTSGNLVDDQHEGHRGEIISDINTDSNTGIYASPNIVLLHAGTNNMKNDADAASAPGDLKALIDKILAHAKDPVVFVAQIIPSLTTEYNERVKVFNKAIPGIVASYTDKKVIMVNMYDALTTDDMADNLHPKDSGYKKMGDEWYTAIKAADEAGLITEAGEGEAPPATTTGPESCQSTPSWYRKRGIADGAKIATSDGDFKQVWRSMGVVAEGSCPRAQLHLMDLNGDGLKDYACVDPDTGAVTVRINIKDADGKTSGYWEKPQSVATGATGRDGGGVMFADLNGDGRDDYIYLDPDTGDVSAWINQLQNDDGVWLWQSLGKIAGGIGAKNDSLQMVDIDGDGRDDFLLVDQTTGAVKAWLNTGPDVIPDYHNIYEIATGASASSTDKIIMGDFTRNGRADYMIVGAGGRVDGLVNRLQEKSLVPRWLAPVTVATGPSGAHQAEVRMVDMTGDGKVDYLLIDEETGQITLWENIGSGGKYQPGEGVFLCDLDGDGTSDYFWIDHTGKGYGYLNKGKGSNVWDSLNQIAFGDHNRDNIRMAVLTSSKRADYIVVDDSGEVQMWKNLGADGGWGWSGQGVIANPKNTIETEFGWKFNAKNVRFADLDGDKLDDFLYVGPQGATVRWANKGTNPPTWGVPYLVADGPGVLPQEVQFADTDGDGLLDYVVVGRVNGRARSWHNLGFRTDGTNSIRWNTPLSFADGVGTPGRTIRITEMTGDKRYDYVSINPDNGGLDLWINRCMALGYPESPGDELCKWDPEEAAAWDASGASDLVDNFIVNTGNNDWLARADAVYHLGSGTSGLNCDDVEGGTNFCPIPSDACSSWTEPAFWYVRFMAARIQSQFQYAHEKLQDKSIRNLALIDQMIIDFKTEVPDKSLLVTIFANLASAFGIAGALAGRATAGGADIFNLLSAVFWMADSNVDQDVDDLDKVAAASKAYVAAILDGASTQLEDTLPQFFGNTNLENLSKLYNKLKDSGLVPEESDKKSLVGRTLDGGEMMVPILESDIAEALSDGINDTIGTVLGNLLAGLHYMVVGPALSNEEACNLTPAARFVDDYCLYLVRRPAGKKKSETVPAEDITKIEKTYGVRLYDMLKNVKACSNKNATDVDRTTIYVGSERYPPCYFGLAYVDALGALDYPVTKPQNADDLPDWIEDEPDLWNDPRETACTLDSWKDYPACQNI